ncbi:MAG TPA: 1-deoxy-D-xylulose-5-phosphate synthase [Candidatus Marinimicrobia bacterium]|nr:1-deoxy-D-xylulose-5-phosphate synthase [Candidatus Neomarinimicrobiota bacterium]
MLENTEKSFEYKLLNKIDSPKDLKKLSISELHLLSSEIRHYIIETVKMTGGHLAPSLGVIELTIALHYVFDTPDDKLVWDVGHQAYSHKILTGRREQIRNIRQYGGISGFCKIKESEYDVFGAGHASTSISAAVGLAVARDLKGLQDRVVAIIGDGALTGGMAFEGINNVCNVKGQFLVVLNDNEMSISRNVGNMSQYLTRIVTSPQYLNFKNQVWNSLALLPKGVGMIRKLGRKTLESLKNFLAPGILFEEFGFRYYGPVDGHDINLLITTLNNIKNLDYPVLLHVITQKGRGLAIAENDPTKYHGVGPVKKKNEKKTDSSPAFMDAFGKIACEIGEKNDKVIFITAAMCDGTGLVEFRNRFPERFFDVGIAEEHAVTSAGGLAVGGFRPVVAIYSTFLQRAFDQIIHDIALQNLPVIFVLDRAGLVGADGPTHHGAFDLSYLMPIPNMIIAVPRNGNELRDLLHTALAQNKKPFAIRYPKDSCVEFSENLEPEVLDIGSWIKIREGKDIAILSVGTMTNVAEKAIGILEGESISPTLIHAQFIKPFDESLLKEIAANYNIIMTIEENALTGGFGSVINSVVAKNKWDINTVSLGLPDHFIEQGPRDLLLKNINLDPEGIAAEIRKAVNSK